MAEIVDQPPPVATDRRPAWGLVIEYTETLWSTTPPPAGAIGSSSANHALVIADMRERDRVGRERYGVPLQAGNGRRHLIDAYQELQDFAVYLRTWFDEHNIDPAGDHMPSREELCIIRSLAHALADLHILRDLIERGL